MSQNKMWPKATRASFISGIPKIHHNSCGGKISKNIYTNSWHCSTCSLSWSDDYLGRLTNDEISDRFHLRGDNEFGGYTLVYIRSEGTGKSYTALVPTCDAGNHERVTFI